MVLWLLVEFSFIFCVCVSFVFVSLLLLLPLSNYIVKRHYSLHKTEYIQSNINSNVAETIFQISYYFDEKWIIHSRGSVINLVFQAIKQLSKDYRQSFALDTSCAVKGNIIMNTPNTIEKLIKVGEMLR